MKAAASAADIQSAAKFLAPAVMARPMAPVLGGVLISADESGLLLRATDYETFAAATAPATTQDDFEPILVSYRLLAQVLSVCSGEVELTQERPRAPLAVRSGRAQWELPAMTDEFPSRPRVADPLGTIDGAQLAAAAKVVAPAADDEDAGQIGFSALCMEFDEQGLHLVATDRYRVHVQTVGWSPVLGSGKPRQVLAHARTFSRFVDAMPGDVEMSVDDVTLTLAAPGRSITARQVATQTGKWLDWRQFMGRGETAQPATSVVIEAADLALALRQAIALAPVEKNKQRHAVITLTGDGARIDAGETDTGKAGVDIPGEVTGRPVRIVAAIAYLLEVLPLLPPGPVQLDISHPFKPIKVSTPGDPPTAIVMPVRRDVAGYLDGRP